MILVSYDGTNSVFERRCHKCQEIPARKNPRESIGEDNEQPENYEMQEMHTRRVQGAVGFANNCLLQHGQIVQSS